MMVLNPLQTISLWGGTGSVGQLSGLAFAGFIALKWDTATFCWVTNHHFVVLTDSKNWLAWRCGDEVTVLCINGNIICTHQVKSSSTF